MSLPSSHPLQPSPLAAAMCLCSPGDNRPNPATTHTYPFLLIFHQHLLQSYFLACLAMFGFENFPVKKQKKIHEQQKEKEATCPLQRTSPNKDTLKHFTKNSVMSQYSHIAWAKGPQDSLNQQRPQSSCSFIRIFSNVAHFEHKIAHWEPSYKSPL